MSAFILSDELVRTSASPLGVRMEEMWHILWIAGLIDDADYYGDGPRHDTLARALDKANQLNAARSSA